MKIIPVGSSNKLLPTMKNIYFAARTFRKIRKKTRFIADHISQLEKDGFEEPIVVVGYPKSGNTWLTRLIADTLNCPSKGYAGIPCNHDIAVEGEERASNRFLLKSHHVRATWDRVRHPRVKMISIVRDPRDVAASGAHYHFHNQPGAAANMVSLMTTERHGHYWNRRSWAGYVDDFLAAGIPLIRYEDLLADTEASLARLLTEAGLDFDPERLAKAVENQSFDKARARYFEAGNADRIRHMRCGRVGSHAEELPPQEVSRLSRALAPTMIDLGYLR
ncbi:sulfotransferase domain-containing protein [Roseibium polysiphoniae]|uniref:sulfotransferase domain-containing protein n=1 Tax=Roseibium polysiphoniae TaxID=2571221 RepID=UPI00329795BE